MNDPHWRDQAMCADITTAEFEKFFPNVSRGRAGSRPAFAVALDVIGRYCDHCPVVTQCGAEAERLEREQNAVITGVWAGALRYRSRKNADTIETSHVLTASELRVNLALEPDPEPEPVAPRTPVCRWCHTNVGTRKDGTMRVHTMPGTVEACPGMGMPPADEQVA